MMSLTFGLFTQVSGSGPLGPLVVNSHDAESEAESQPDNGRLVITCISGLKQLFV